VAAGRDPRFRMKDRLRQTWIKDRLCEIWDSPPSPCNAVCALHPETGFCRGCFRTIDEIAAWTTMTAEERRRVLALLPARRNA
jgi:predicted Fe-S protein YdhL (DUF1289 family)